MDHRIDNVLNYIILLT